MIVPPCDDKEMGHKRKSIFKKSITGTKNISKRGRRQGMEIKQDGEGTTGVWGAGQVAIADDEQRMTAERIRVRIPSGVKRKEILASALFRLMFIVPCTG
jgi:hypothetical protein